MKNKEWTIKITKLTEGFILERDGKQYAISDSDCECDRIFEENMGKPEKQGK